MRRITLSLLAVAATAATAAGRGGECPVDACLCSVIEECSPGEEITTDLFLSVDFQLNAPGCTVASSSGSLAVGAAALSFSSGQTMGDCIEFDSCFSLDTGIDADAAFDPNLGAIDLDAMASASTTAAQSEATTTGHVDPLAVRLTIDTESEFSNKTTNCASYEQVTTYLGMALAAAGAGGGFTTTFQQPCPGLTGTLELTMDKQMIRVCDDDCPGCPINEFPLCVVHIRASAIFGGALDAGDPPPPVMLEGVYGAYRADDGTIQTAGLGFLDDPRFDPIGQADTISIDIPVAPGSQMAIGGLEYDIFGRHDGDINGDTVLCPADRYLMDQAIGSSIGDAAYTARADFDLDGTVGPEDVDAFRLAVEDEFAPSDACPCPTDIDDSGDTGFSDLLIILASWGDCGERSLCAGDQDGDGNIGFNDLLSVLAAWGECP